MDLSKHDQINFWAITIFITIFLGVMFGLFRLSLSDIQNSQPAFVILSKQLVDSQSSFEIRLNSTNNRVDLLERQVDRINETMAHQDFERLHQNDSTTGNKK